MQSPRREAQNDKNWDPVHLTRYHHPRVGFSAPANDGPLVRTFLHDAHIYGNRLGQALICTNSDLSE